MFTFCYLRDFLPKLFRFSIYRGQLYFVQILYFLWKSAHFLSRRLFILCKTDGQDVSNLPLFCNNILQAVQLKVIQVVIVFYKHEQTDSSNGEINTQKNPIKFNLQFPSYMYMHMKKNWCKSNQLKYMCIKGRVDAIDINKRNNSQRNRCGCNMRVCLYTLR